MQQVSTRRVACAQIPPIKGPVVRYARLRPTQPLGRDCPAGIASGRPASDSISAEPLPRRDRQRAFRGGVFGAVASRYRSAGRASAERATHFRRVPKVLHVIEWAPAATQHMMNQNRNCLLLDGRAFVAGRVASGG